MLKKILPCILALLWTAFAYSLDDPYKIEYKGLLKEKSQSLENSQFDRHHILDPSLSNKIDGLIFERNLESTPHFISDRDQLTSIYEVITQDLWEEFEQIGKVLVGEVESYQRNFDLGLINAQGFEWQKPYGFFKIYNKRKIEEVNSSKWQAIDTFVLEIDADTFLKLMKEKDLIEITQLALDAFAGLKFQKIFKYTHFHQSYDEALNSDFKKLFFPFIYSSSFDDFQVEDSLRLYDSLSIKAGVKGFVTWGPYLSLSVGSEYYFNLIKETLLEKEKKDLFKLEKGKAQNQSFQLNASLQASFLKLINITLFDYSYRYSASKSFKRSYSLKPSELENLNYNKLITNYLNQTGFTERQEQELGPYLTYQSDNEAHSSNSSLNFLVWKNEKGSHSETIVVNPSGERKDIFHKESLFLKKTKTTFWGFLKGTILGSLLGFSINTNVISAESSHIEIEYENQRTRNLSIKIYRDFYHRLKKRKDRRKAASLLREQTVFPENFYAHNWEDSINFRQEISLNSKNLNSLFYQSTQDIHNQIERYCNNAPKRRFKRKCNRKLKRHFDKLKSHYLKTLDYEVNSLKVFLKYLVKYNQKYEDLESFWNPKSIRLKGEFQSYAQEIPFKTYFHSGFYDGITVLESYYKSLE